MPLVDHGHLPDAGVLSNLPDSRIAPGFNAGSMRLADDLVAHAGRGLVAVGQNYSVSGHDLVARINLALGNTAADLPPASRLRSA